MNTKTNQPKSSNVGVPNPEAVNKLLNRYYLWLAKRKLNNSGETSDEIDHTDNEQRTDRDAQSSDAPGRPGS